MQAALQSGGSSGRSLTGPASSLQLKSSTDIVQNAHSASGRARKRERVEQNLDPSKRERLDNSDRNTSEREHGWKSDILSLVGEDGGLFNLACVDRLLYLMQHDRNDGVRKPVDVVLCRSMLASVISATDQSDCLHRFVKLGGLPLLDEWLQETHKGKPEDNGSPREGERGSEDLLLILLCALDRLPVDLVALKTCSVGKSVNNLRSHRNLEIQKRARRLVDVWKKRVDDEMKQSGELKQLTSDQINALQLKGGDFSEAAMKSCSMAVSVVKPVPHNSSTSEFTAHGESSSTGTGKFASVASLCTPSFQDNQIKVPSGSRLETPSNNSGQSTVHGSVWPNGMLKSVNTSFNDENAKGNLSYSLHNKTNVLGSRPHMRPGKGNVGACQADGFGKSLVWSRNVTSERVGHAVFGSDIRASVGDRMESMNNHSATLRNPNYGQSTVNTTCGGSLVELSSPSSGSSSPSMSDNHAHLDSCDVTDGRNREMFAQAASSPERIVERRSHISTDKDRASLLSKTRDSIEGNSKEDEEGGKYWKSSDCTPITGQTAGSNRDVHVEDTKHLDAPVTSSGVSNENLSGKVGGSSLDLATVGINLLASVAASECSMNDGKVCAAASDRRSSVLGGAIISQERKLALKAGPLQWEDKVDSQQAPVQTEASGISTEREHYDRNSSTVSSPSDVETIYDTGIDEDDKATVRPSDGHVSADAPAALETASCDGQSPGLDSIPLTPNLPNLPSEGVGRKLEGSVHSPEIPSVDGADSEDLCKSEATITKANKNCTGKYTQVGEGMEESQQCSSSGVGELDSCEFHAMDEGEKDVKVTKARQALTSPNVSDFQKESDASLRYLGEDALEVARQVAMEVEQEMVGYQKVSSDKETSDINSVQSRVAIEMRGGYSASVMEQSWKSLKSGTRVENSVRQSPSETIASPRLDTVTWNLNNRLDEKTEPANLNRVDQAQATSGYANLGGGDFRPPEESKRANASGSSPSSPQLAIPTRGLRNQSAVCIMASPQQVSKQLSCSAKAGGSNTLEQAVIVISSDEAVAKVNDAAERPDFDLNEGLTGEEGYFHDSASAFAFTSTKLSPLFTGAGVTAPIAVVAATKGPFIPPASPFRVKGELGWKGSAATSAFRPAQRRTPERQNIFMEKLVADVDHHPNAKQTKPFLDFDLNVAAEKSSEDAGASVTVPSQVGFLKPGIQNPCVSSRQLSALTLSNDLVGSCKSENKSQNPVKPSWDLNCVDEGEEGGAVLALDFKTAESLQSCIKNAKNTMLDFDLNNGPTLEDGDDLVPSCGVGKNSGMSAPSISGIRTATEVINEGQLVHGRNSFSAVTLPAFTAARSESPFPVGSAQSYLNAGPITSPFHYDIYRPGAGFPSSGIGYPTPPQAGFSYAGFPFGFNPATFRTISAPFMDSSEQHSFPAISLQMLSTESVVPSQMKPPYLMGVPDPVGPNGDSVWVRPTLDLNAGPESGEADAKDERSISRQLSVLGGLEDHRRVGGLEDHRRAFHHAVEVGESLKRKEPEGCWGLQRAVFKQPMWQ